MKRTLKVGDRPIFTHRCMKHLGPSRPGGVMMYYGWGGSMSDVLGTKVEIVYVLESRGYRVIDKYNREWSICRCALLLLSDKVKRLRNVCEGRA